MSKDTSTKKREIFPDDIAKDNMELKGKGAFGKVFKTHLKGNECALKLIDLQIIIKEENGLN